MTNISVCCPRPLSSWPDHRLRQNFPSGQHTSAILIQGIVYPEMKITSFVFCRKTVIQFWNDMRVSKWIFFFWWTVLHQISINMVFLSMNVNSHFVFPNQHLENFLISKWLIFLLLNHFCFSLSHFLSFSSLPVHFFYWDGLFWALSSIFGKLLYSQWVTLIPLSNPAPSLPSRSQSHTPPSPYKDCT